ncbi:MAG: hypothetical protein H7A21_13205 [Spirochaetales bacterium]|nr:hypothetical protein [Leptospiraceae bacterium]MCP5482386.1 hypothetical protein [Spirochaetales bacterium]MCP5484175.1 hypothetical protein [Spirochaetales bacterium]
MRTQWPCNAGAGITLALGLLGPFFPSGATRFPSIQAVGRIGISEIRARYGGFFTGRGASARLLQRPALFAALAVVWPVAAAARLLSLCVERSYEKENTGDIFFEAGIALLLRLGETALG